MKKYINYAKTLTELMGSLGYGATKRENVGSMGFNAKKCKSCKDFTHCHMALNIKPTDNACREYKPKKRR